MLSSSGDDQNTEPLNTSIAEQSLKCCFDTSILGSLPSWLHFRITAVPLEYHSDHTMNDSAGVSADCKDATGAKAVANFKPCFSQTANGKGMYEVADKHKSKGFDTCAVELAQVVKGMKDPDEKDSKKMEECFNELKKSKDAIMKC
ncbi:unnamed protein product [Oppiella nova]|uniref:Uncharacterized protein n=1 Tax=Oppiella nova TaxID=334625 RepID=A0A7R9QH51_9ACAR|nr:unnamed protein product [Oppiella nova]CAG2165251.1 unnamed protein product [Oppiella nova]